MGHGPEAKALGHSSFCHNKSLGILHILAIYNYNLCIKSLLIWLQSQHLSQLLSLRALTNKNMLPTPWKWFSQERINLWVRIWQIVGGQISNMLSIDPRKPQDNIERAEPELNLRGGKDCDGHCRGRFCFIIPCPIPINCCVIPL